jgi:hypothetical protein
VTGLKNQVAAKYFRLELIFGYLKLVNFYFGKDFIKQNSLFGIEVVFIFDEIILL